MDFYEVLRVIAKAARSREVVEIYYPATESSSEGWREIEPYSLTTDVPPEGEHLVYSKDRLSPGHILNARIPETGETRSFIVGKIKQARTTKKKFTPKEGWKVEF